MSKQHDQNTQCAFCGKAKNEVAILVAGLDAHICEMCIEQAHHIIKEEFDTKKKKDAKGLFTAQKPHPCQNQSSP